jgi:cyanuric acid amidohydrolase
LSAASPGGGAQRIRAFNLETRGPADVAELTRLLDAGEFRAEDVLCILGKTEGNGGRNDFSRDLAMKAFEQLFAPRLGCRPEEVQDRVIFSLSGGTEGVVTPHVVVFVREAAPAPAVGEPRLCAAIGQTRDFRADEIGRMPQVGRPRGRCARSSPPWASPRCATSTSCR